MKSVGKIFENNFKASCPKEWFYYRFIDGTASYDESQATRFQLSNICDCFIFTGSKLIFCELKSFKGNSFQFSNIRKHQLIAMERASYYKNIMCYFILNAREIKQTTKTKFPFNNKTYFLTIATMLNIINTSTKKSINIKEIEEHPKIYELPSKKKKVHFTYDLTVLETHEHSS